MPLYNYKCSCNKEFEAFENMSNGSFSKCPNCGKMAEQTISTKPAAVHGFKFGEFRDILPDPINVRGKQHLKDLCEEHECYAPGVLD